MNNNLENSCTSLVVWKPSTTPLNNSDIQLDLCYIDVRRIKIYPEVLQFIHPNGLYVARSSLADRTFIASDDIRDFLNKQAARVHAQIQIRAPFLHHKFIFVKKTKSSEKEMKSSKEIETKIVQSKPAKAYSYASRIVEKEKENQENEIALQRDDLHFCISTKKRDYIAKGKLDGIIPNLNISQILIEKLIVESIAQQTSLRRYEALMNELEDPHYAHDDFTIALSSASFWAWAKQEYPNHIDSIAKAEKNWKDKQVLQQNMLAKLRSEAQLAPFGKNIGQSVLFNSFLTDMKNKQFDKKPPVNDFLPTLTRLGETLHLSEKDSKNEYLIWQELAKNLKKYPGAVKVFKDAYIAFKEKYFVSLTKFKRAYLSHEQIQRFESAFWKENADCGVKPELFRDFCIKKFTEVITQLNEEYRVHSLTRFSELLNIHSLVATLVANIFKELDEFNIDSVCKKALISHTIKHLTRLPTPPTSKKEGDKKNTHSKHSPKKDENNYNPAHCHIAPTASSVLTEINTTTTKRRFEKNLLVVTPRSPEFFREYQGQHSKNGKMHCEKYCKNLAPVFSPLFGPIGKYSWLGKWQDSHAIVYPALFIPQPLDLSSIFKDATLPKPTVDSGILNINKKLITSKNFQQIIQVFTSLIKYNREVYRNNISQFLSNSIEATLLYGLARSSETSHFPPFYNQADHTAETHIKNHTTEMTKGWGILLQTAKPVDIADVLNSQSSYIEQTLASIKNGFAETTEAYNNSLSQTANPDVLADRLTNLMKLHALCDIHSGLMHAVYETKKLKKHVNIEMSDVLVRPTNSGLASDFSKVNV